jgi:hypothetical protein
MHPPPIPAVPVGSQNDATEPDKNSKDIPSSRRDSMSQQSEGSQTADDFLRDQRQLEADAREALPYVCDPYSPVLLHLPHIGSNMYRLFWTWTLLTATRP